jgi:hypothetical protein
LSRARDGVCTALSVALSLAALLGQLAAPLLHTLGSQPRTAPRALTVTAAPATLADGSAAPVEHHDAGACPVCRSLQQSRHAAKSPSVVALAFHPPLPLRPATASIPASAPARANAAPRAPPRFS